MTVCAIPQSITASIVGTSATSIVIQKGESVTVEAIYVTDPVTDPCTQVIAWNQQKVGGFPSGWGSTDPASEATVYSKTWTPPSRGTWSVWVALTWYENEPHVLAPHLLDSNTLTIVAYADTEEVDATIPERTAIAGAEERTAAAGVEDTTATAGVEARGVDAELPTRSVGAGAD